MTILTQINPSKAQQLVEALGLEAAWLMQLPIAAEAVADCALANLELGKGTSQLRLAAESKRGTHGYYRSFENGVIHWTESSGVHAFHGQISGIYARWGGSGSLLGFPVTLILPADRSSFGTEGGLIQRFEGGGLYYVLERRIRRESSRRSNKAEAPAGRWDSRPVRTPKSDRPIVALMAAVNVSKAERPIF
jgi:hypothetical protein